MKCPIVIDPGVLDTFAWGFGLGAACMIVPCVWVWHMKHRELLEQLRRKELAERWDDEASVGERPR